MWRAWHAAFSLLAICTSVHAAEAQSAPETFSLSIARQPLDGALQQLARQCDVQMITGPPQFVTGTTSTRDEYGIFAALRVYFDNAWSIVGGARLSGDSTDSQSTLRLGPIRQVALASYGTDQVVTPYAGLMYAFDRHYSLYASYADIYRAQMTLAERAPGNLLEPMQGVNVEAGIKGEWRNGALNGSLALYRIEQSNLPVRKLPPANQVLGGPSCCYTGGSSKSRGVDVELSGELMPRWTLSAGYTYNENESSMFISRHLFTPQHLLKAWTNVTLPGAFNRWQIGGGLHAQSETKFFGCGGPPSRCVVVVGVQPAYAVLDLRAGFDVDRNWRIALTVNNVLDKTYYEFIGNSSSTPPLQGWYGEPRNWVLRIDGRY